MKSIVIESQYLPPISAVKAMANSSKVIIDHYERYQRRSYRNRCHILAANGMQRLSVPLIGGKNQEVAMKDVKISYEENWQKVHFTSIETAYNRSAFFEYYKDEFRQFYIKKYTFLIDLNMDLLQFVLKNMKLPCDIDLSNEYIEKSKEFDFRNAFMPKKTQVTKPYPQVFCDRFDFIPDLSAIDLLFNCGPAGLNR